MASRPVRKDTRVSILCVVLTRYCSSRVRYRISYIVLICTCMSLESLSRKVSTPSQFFQDCSITDVRVCLYPFLHFYSQACSPRHLYIIPRGLINLLVNVADLVSVIYSFCYSPRLFSVLSVSLISTRAMRVPIFINIDISLKWEPIFVLLP